MFVCMYPLFEYGDFLPKLEAGDSEVKIKMLFPFLYPVLSYFSRALNFVKDSNECPHVLIDWILRSNFKLLELSEFRKNSYLLKSDWLRSFRLIPGQSQFQSKKVLRTYSTKHPLYFYSRVKGKLMHGSKLAPKYH